MNSDAKERLRFALAAIVEQHLPSAARASPGNLGFGTVSEFHAERLLDAFNAPLVPFGLGPSADDWKRLRKAATELQRALLGLGQDGMREIKWNTPLWWDKAEKPLAQEAYFLAHMLKEASATMEKERKANKAPSKKRNWQAAALAKVAREIWAQEEWDSKPEKYGLAWNALAGEPPPELHNALAPSGAYERHLREFAPKSGKSHVFGPFGRFLNDVFSCLSLKAAPASALNSLAAVQGKLARGS